MMRHCVCLVLHTERRVGIVSGAGTLTKSCLVAIKCNYREALDLWTLNAAPEIVCDVGPGANPNVVVDQGYMELRYASFFFLLVYNFFIPRWLLKRLKKGVTASKHIDEGVSEQFMSLDHVLVRSKCSMISDVVGILPPNVMVIPFEEGVSAEGTRRIRIGGPEIHSDTEWVSVVQTKPDKSVKDRLATRKAMQMIKKKDKKLKKQEKAGKLHRTLMANEKEIYVLNSNFQESYGWAVLKYKPERYVLHCLQ